MSEPNLTEVFGSNVTQDASSLTISKIDLAAVGLTASATNTAESLFVAIILQVALYLNTTNQNSINTDIQVTVDDSGFPQLVSRNSSQWRQITYNVNLQTPDSGFSIDPDAY